MAKMDGVTKDMKPPRTSRLKSAFSEAACALLLRQGDRQTWRR